MAPPPAETTREPNGGPRKRRLLPLPLLDEASLFSILAEHGVKELNAHRVWRELVRTEGRLDIDALLHLVPRLPLRLKGLLGGGRFATMTSTMVGVGEREVLPVRGGCESAARVLRLMMWLCRAGHVVHPLL